MRASVWSFVFVGAFLFGSQAVPLPVPTEPQTVPQGFTCLGHTYAQGSGDVIQNGGFEQDLTGWYAAIPQAQLFPTISTTIVHSGAKAAKVDADPSTPNHAEQNGSFQSALTLYSFAFYPETWGPGGHFVSEILRNWTPSAGTAESITGVTMFPSSVRWFSWRSFGGTGVVQDVPVSVAAGVWHSVQIVMDRQAGVQCLFVDGAAVASTSMNPSDTFDGDVVLFGDASQVGDAGVAYYDEESLVPLTVVVRGSCPLSQGYWKNHPAAWPVDSLVLGTTTYSKAGLLAILGTPPRGDASLVLAHQLIAAKLNVAHGTDPAPIAAVLADADSLLGTIPGQVAPSSSLGQKMVADAAILDEFNNGQLTQGC